MYAIQNDFFGEKITVSGLLTGQDIRRQLEGKPLGEKLLLPCNLLRSGEEVFLDDMTLGELEKGGAASAASSGQETLFGSGSPYPAESLW